MPLSTRIRDQFENASLASALAFDVLSEPIARAAQEVTDCLMREGRVLVYGAGSGGLLGRHLTAILTDRLEHDRPGLAALFIDGSGMGDDTDPTRGSRRQLEALAHPGDLLIVFSLYGEGHAVHAAIRAAHDREIRVIAFSGGEGGPLAETLREDDQLICAPSASAPRILETQLLAIHSLGACIDYLLLGA